MTSLLELRALVAGYPGGGDVLRGVDLTVGEDEIVGIVGPNGAGKSTLLETVFGFVPVRAGTMSMGGEDLTRFGPHERVELGIGYVPQLHNVFAHLTVADNLRMGSYRAPEGAEAARERVASLFPAIVARLGDRAGDLSGGQRQMLAIARALMAAPTTLLLDEPTAGLDPAGRADLVEHLLEVNRTGVALLVVEQNVRVCVETCHRVVVLDRGTTVFEGAGEAVLADPGVRRILLGGLSRS